MSLRRTGDWQIVMFLDGVDWDGKSTYQHIYEHSDGRKAFVGPGYCSDPDLEWILFQLKSIGIDAVAEDAMSSMSIEQQETAIAISTYIAHSDKVLCKKEDAFLNKLALSSKIPNDKARAIIDSIILLHRDIFT